MILDSIFSTFLIFNKIYIHIPVIVFGLMSARRSDFFGAWICYLLAIFLTGLLKIYFKVPLIYQASSENYGFPSGHTMVSIAIYGYLFLCFSSTLLRGILLTIAAGNSMAVVYFGYHTYFDIAGAWFFSTILILSVYYVGIFYQKIQTNPRYLSAFSFLFGVISFLILSQVDYLRLGVLQALGISLGILVSSVIWKNWLNVQTHTLRDVLLSGLIGCLMFKGSYLLIYETGFLDTSKAILETYASIILIVTGALPAVLLIWFVVCYKPFMRT
ncbi:MAG: hypothetical protein C0582_02725 [Alphaproteobacteria bacterium]|nr:MAG: hypothetical protein C0582_02725 [Alphaproteobacteria bacterium]